MSRPFSYNDENFTVIGNVLFVHIIDNKAWKAFEPVVEVPPAIYERLKTYITICFVSLFDLNDNSRIQSVFVIKDFENKHYLEFSDNIPATNNVKLYWSIYFLKDI